MKSAQSQPIGSNRPKNDFQRQAELDEGGRQKLQIGQQGFAFVDFGASENATAVVEHIQQWIKWLRRPEPMIRRRVHLPEFTDGLPLPAPQVGWKTGRLGCRADPFPNRPMPDLRTGQHNTVESIHLAGRKGIVVTLVDRGSQEALDPLLPWRSMIAAGHARPPLFLLSHAPCLQILSAQRVEPTLAYAQGFARLFDG